MTPPDLSKSASLSPSAQRTDFLEDITALFTTKESGHLNSYAFNEPLPEPPDDPVRGGEHWENFISASKDYYLITEEAKIIRNSAIQLGRILPEDAICIDLGPGEARSVLGKTLPCLQGMHRPFGYIAVDINNSFVSTATQLVSENTDVFVRGLTADFFTDPLDLDAHQSHPNVMILFGGLLCNLGHSQQSPVNELAAKFGLLRQQARVGDYLVVTQDTNQNADDLMRAYTHPDLAKYILSLMHKIKRDLPTHDFDADAFEFNSAWHPKEHVVTLSARAKRLTTFQIAGRAFAIRAGQVLPLVNCYKFSADMFIAAAEQSGFTCEKTFGSSGDRIVMHVFKCA